MKVEVLNPHGFCAGVAAALKKALALADEAGGEPIWCLHELVHNELVVAALKERGFRFVETVDDVPEGARLLLSAHGVSPQVRERARARRLRVVDATCPFVALVHRQVRDFVARGLPVVVIGRRDHAEVEGIVGEAERVWIYPELPPPGTRIGVVSQTTMNADEVEAILARLKRDYAVETSARVCNATKERQDAVRAFRGDALLVLGSANSSNTRRLAEVASCRTFRVGTEAELRALDLSGVERLGVTSGASTPEEFLAAAVRMLAV